MNNCIYDNIFSFEDDLYMVDPDKETVYGSLNVTESLQDRLKKGLENCGLDEHALSSMNTFDFYATYKPLSDKSLCIFGVCYGPSTSEQNKDERYSLELPISEDESAFLKHAIESHCREFYNTSCIGYVESVSQSMDKPSLKKSQENQMLSAIVSKAKTEQKVRHASCGESLKKFDPRIER